MKYYIYKIINTINGKSYVGQHKIPLKNEPFRRYMGKGIAIRAAIKKYGKKNFSKEILEYIDDDECHKTVSEREIFWIKKENTLYPNGYNLSPGGEGGCTKESALKGVLTKKAHGYKVSKETRDKISKSKKGKTFSEEHKKHLSEHHHFRTLHIIIFEDGHKIETYKSLSSIAKEFGISQNTLLRSSSKGEFKNGIMLEGIKKEKYACCQNKDKSKYILCNDPILNDITSLRNLRLRIKRKPWLYKNIEPKDYIIKK